MYAHIQGQTLLMSELDKFRIILAESDYILPLAECNQYEIHNDVLVKKEHDMPTLYDAIHASMTLEEYVKRYPERHNYNNRLDQFTPSFRRTSST